MLAYSAIGQVGYVLVAVGIGGPVGFAAAILYSILNSLNKTLLFLTTRMRGALVGWVFLLGALSVAGVPPAAGFVGKLQLFHAAAGAPVLLVLLFLGSAMSLLYAFQIYQYDFWRTERPGPRSPRGQQVVLAAIAVVVLGAGLWPEPLLRLSDAAAEVLTTGVADVGDVAGVAGVP
jgi:multicomponent Na+:H+ antiporter subunit D